MVANGGEGGDDTDVGVGGFAKQGDEVDSEEVDSHHIDYFECVSKLNVHTLS